MKPFILLSALILSCSAAAEAPQPLDFSRFFWERFVTPTRTNTSFATILGRREFDGIPFQVDGRAYLYGRTQGGRREMNGIAVGRAFDELHLLHAAQWSDVEGTTIAFARLNYEDGSRHEFPLGYGVHVRDWQRLQSEEKEIITDPATKVVWRGPGMAHFKSTQRMFKSTLVNPNPGKVVTTIDFVSAGQIASYDLSAATVADHDPSRPVSPHIALDEPERNFDGRVAIRVEDTLGRPIDDVWVYPSISVPDTGWATAATPLYSDFNGACTSRYPRATSTWLKFIARKPGWRTSSQRLFFKEGSLPGDFTVLIRMEPDPGVIPPPPGPGLAATPSPAAPPAAPIPGPTAPATGAAANAGTSAGAAATVKTATPVPYRPPLILMIGFPSGSRVRIERSATLSNPEWVPHSVIESLPASPYPFVCEGCDDATSQMYFRAVYEGN